MCFMSWKMFLHDFINFIINTWTKQMEHEQFLCMNQFFFVFLSLITCLINYFNAFIQNLYIIAIMQFKPGQAIKRVCKYIILIYTWLHIHLFLIMHFVLLQLCAHVIFHFHIFFLASFYMSSRIILIMCKFIVNFIDLFFTIYLFCYLVN